LLTKAIEEEGLDICIEGMQKHRTIDEYVEAWRIQIWDYGYMGWFKGKEAYTKTKAFEDLGVRTWQSSTLSSGMIAMD
jgi:hypothetical protein